MVIVKVAEIGKVIPETKENKHIWRLKEKP